MFSDMSRAFTECVNAPLKEKEKQEIISLLKHKYITPIQKTRNTNYLEMNVTPVAPILPTVSKVTFPEAWIRYSKVLDNTQFDEQIVF